MAEREAIYKLKFQVDKSGQQESIRAIDALGKEFAELDENAQQFGKSSQIAAAKLAALDAGREELRATAREAKYAEVGITNFSDALKQAGDASDHMSNVRDEVRETREELNKAADAANNLGGRLDAADENFDVVSRRVGLAGDVQSNLGSIRGLSQTAGLGSTGEAIGVAGELAALTEELPRLKAALSSMPDVVKFVASEIGAPGIGLIGTLALLAGAFALLAKVTEEEKNRKLAELKAAEEFSVFSATATTEEARVRRETTETEIKRQQERLIAIQKQLGESDDKLRENAEKNLGSLFGDGAVTDALAKGFASATQGLSDIGLGNGDIQGLEEEAKRLSTALDEDITSFNLLTMGLVDGTFAANDATKAIDAQAQATVNSYQTQYDLQLKYQDLVTNGSKAQLDQLLKQNELQLDANRVRVNGLFEEIEIYKNQGKEIPEILQTAFDDALQVTNDLYASQIYLTETAQPLIEARETEAKLIAKTTSVLGEVAGKIAAASAEQQQVTKERVAALKEQAKEELEFSRFLKGATLENVTARVTALKEEAAALRSMLPELEALAPTSKAAADELAVTNDRLAEISAEMARLDSEGVIAAIQREQAELTAEIIKIEQARDEKILQIRAQAAAKEAELFQSLQQDLADAVADANESRVDALRDYEEKAAEITEDLARKRLDIEKKYSRDAANAVGDRDALALYQAKQTRDDGLEDAEEAAAQQRADTQRNYAQQLDTINRELAKQQQTLQAKYTQQLNDLRTATNNSINAERQKAAQEIQVRQQAYQQELAQLNSFAQSGVASVTAFATGSLTTLGTFVERAREIMAGLIGSATSTPTTPIPTPAPIPIPPIIRPPGAPGGPQQPVAGVNINIAGYTAAQIQAELNKVLKQMIPN